MEWLNANPNVKSYFIKAFTRVGRDNPFYEMEQARSEEHTSELQSPS